MPSLRILIVEDELDVCELFVEYLKMSGFEDVRYLHKGEEAIDTVRRQSFDLIFLDLKLADRTSGFEVLNEIKKVSPKTKVVLTSAFQDKDNKKYRDLGVYDFLDKPFKTSDLDRILKKQRTLP